jgi:hypothetical protein
VELAQLGHLRLVRPVVVRARDFQHRRQALQLRVTEEGAELLPDQPLEHVRVPVAVRAEGRLGVVDMQRAEPSEADPGVELVEQRVERAAVGDVVAGDPQVARVQADADAGVPVQSVVQHG